MTTQKTLIRDETKHDNAVITEVTAAAFESLEISNHTEQFIIEALRFARALTLSLVAELDGRVVGHIVFSPVAISDGTANWYGLGPVSTSMNRGVNGCVEPFGQSSQSLTRYIFCSVPCAAGQAVVPLP